MSQPAFDPADFGVITDAPPVPTTINWDHLDPGGYAQTLAKLTAQFEVTDKPSNPEAARKALTTLAHTVMNSAVFLYID